MLRHFAKTNTPMLAVVIFLVLFAAIQWAKPDFLYKHDGSLRDFGIGTQQKTILPIWVLSIIMGILAYLIACNIATPVF